MIHACMIASGITIMSKIFIIIMIVDLRVVTGKGVKGAG